MAEPEPKDHWLWAGLSAGSAASSPTKSEEPIEVAADRAGNHQDSDLAAISSGAVPVCAPIEEQKPIADLINDLIEAPIQARGPASPLVETHQPHKLAPSTFEKAGVLHRFGRLEEAVELYESIPSTHETYEDALANIIAISAARKDYARLEKNGGELLKLRRQSSQALEALMLAGLACGDYKAAAQYGARLVKCASHGYQVSYQAWFNLGFCLHKLNRTEEAAQSYAEAINLNGDCAAARVNLAIILVQRGETGAAQRELEHVLQHHPDHATALWNVANIHEKNNHPKKAEELYLRLITGEQNIAEATFRLGRLRLQQGNFAGAADAFERCLLEQADWSAAWLNLSLAQWRSGDRESAKGTLEKALSRNSSFVQALRLRAALAVEDGDWAGAAVIEARLTKLGENTAELIYNIGVLQQKDGLIDEAAVSYQSALKQNAGFADAQLNLGHVLHVLGQTADAQFAWKAAVEANPELAGNYFKPMLASYAIG